MRPLIQEIATAHTPESLVRQLMGERNVVLLRSALFDSPQSRYSFVTANPVLTFRSFGSRCELSRPQNPGLESQTQFGDPWHLLDSLMSRFEVLDEIDLPFPLGGCFGYWGYDLKNFSEPKLPRRAINDLELPDCCVGFYDSLVVYDHRLGKVCIVSTGLNSEGSPSESRAISQLEFWKSRLISQLGAEQTNPLLPDSRPNSTPGLTTNLAQSEFISAVQRAQCYIRAGDIYQVNLSQRLTAEVWQTPAAAAGPVGGAGCSAPVFGWDFFQRLEAVSPAPFSAFLDCDAGEQHCAFQVASSSPEQFLRLSGSHIVTRPIKGTRPRDADPIRDSQLARELQTSPKELAELVMITDLLRNDLGKICDFGTVQTPELARLEKFPQVQHLVSTVEGRLRPEVTHFAAFAACFPGGSITGAPKFRAMEIIDELEPVSRGPYCGAIGYLGFNRESQLSIAIRTAVCMGEHIHFNVGAGIVADSNPQAEYEETLAKAAGFLAALPTRNTQPAENRGKPLVLKHL